jgi:hypothetical protein
MNFDALFGRVFDAITPCIQDKHLVEVISERRCKNRISITDNSTGLNPMRIKNPERNMFNKKEINQKPGGSSTSHPIGLDGKTKLDPMHCCRSTRRAPTLSSAFSSNELTIIVGQSLWRRSPTISSQGSSLGSPGISARSCSPSSTSSS